MLQLRYKLPILLFLLFSCVLSHTQIAVPFDTTAWDISGNEYEFTRYQGQQALLLEGAAAQLKDVSMQDGVIEWDVAFSPQRGFNGIVFRILDDRNAENFYLRPHQSGKPDANQYCPRDNSLSSWQLFHGEAYSCPSSYTFHEWFHVKMVLSGSRAEVYIDDMDTPALHIPFLQHEPQSGGIVLYASIAPVYFANFSYTPMDASPPVLQNDAVAVAEQDENCIRKWDISSPFGEVELEGLTNLQDWKKELSWQNINAAPTGLTNLATVTPFERNTANTVFVRQTVTSETAQIKALQIGFSDRVRMFCNGKLMFAGNDGFRTRDYRYLGTIGYHDTVYLPLKKGENEIKIAISENFGGWAVQGRWLNRNGIVVDSD